LEPQWLRSIHGKAVDVANGGNERVMSMSNKSSEVETKHSFRCECGACAKERAFKQAFNKAMREADMETEEECPYGNPWA
jgi:hypothetical protein